MRRWRAFSSPWLCWMVLGLVVLGVGLLPRAASAYPISPRTLWWLAADAELIVVARVAEVRELPPAAGDGFRLNSAVAVLEVDEVWKGEAGVSVEVPFPRSMICPAPPVYAENHSVLAFLAWDEASGAWSTVALSYGTLYPAADELADFRRLTRQALTLQKGRRLRRPAVGWLIEAAASPATRWHGLYELIPELDRLHAFYDDLSERPATRFRLSSDHLAVLAGGFARMPRVDPTTPMALGALLDYRSKEVDRAAAAVVEAALADEQPAYWLPEAVFLTLDRFGDPNPRQRLAALQEGPARRAPIEAWRALWQQARVELGIPAVPPAERRDRDVWGVGEGTPD